MDLFFCSFHCISQWLKDQTHRSCFFDFCFWKRVLNCNNNKTQNKDICVEFIRFFHKFVSPIFSTNFPKFEQLKKKKALLLVQVFSQFATWKRNHSKSSLKKIVDLEFEIGETIHDFVIDFGVRFMDFWLWSLDFGF